MSCQSNQGACQSPLDIKAQRQLCHQLKKDLDSAKAAKNWQAYSTTADRFQADCVDMLYYRQNHADNKVQACPNRGMPDE